jgi:N-acetyl-alpha-D-muramate 1-phosphate uridylyltransferase
MDEAPAMKGMILAAGYGTRLAPLTDTLPKALVPVAGRPMILHAVDALRRAGCTELIVNAHHHAGRIEDYFSRHDTGLPVVVLGEREILGTGGGVINAAPLLDKEDQFLLYNSDIATDADLRLLVEVHRNAASAGPAPLATLLVNSRNTTRALLFDGGLRFLGKEAWTADGLAVPPDTLRLGFCGVHVVSGAIFRLGFPQGFSDIFDVYRAGMAQGHNLRGHVTDAYWTDLGSPERIEAHERR